MTVSLFPTCVRSPSRVVLSCEAQMDNYSGDPIQEVSRGDAPSMTGWRKDSRLSNQLVLLDLLHDPSLPSDDHKSGNMGGEGLVVVDPIQKGHPFLSAAPLTGRSSLSASLSLLPASPLRRAISSPFSASSFSSSSSFSGSSLPPLNDLTGGIAKGNSGCSGYYYPPSTSPLFPSSSPSSPTGSFPPFLSLALESSFTKTPLSRLPPSCIISCTTSCTNSSCFSSPLAVASTLVPNSPLSFSQLSTRGEQEEEEEEKEEEKEKEKEQPTTSHSPNLLIQNNTEPDHHLLSSFQPPYAGGGGREPRTGPGRPTPPLSTGPPTVGTPGTAGGPTPGTTPPGGGENRPTQNQTYLDEDSDDVEVDEDEEEEEGGWIEWYCNMPGHLCLAEVDEDYIRDNFNLYGLKMRMGEAYELALDIILGDAPDREDFTDPQFLEQYEAACTLYGYIHSRFIISPKGLSNMRDRYNRGYFGRCPRIYCRSQRMLPIGLKEESGEGNAMGFCPICEELYDLSSQVEHIEVDGSCFGPSFPHIFLQTYCSLIPSAIPVPFEAKVFGFRVHKNKSIVQIKINKGYYGESLMAVKDESVPCETSTSSVSHSVDYSLTTPPVFGHPRPPTSYVADVARDAAVKRGALGRA